MISSGGVLILHLYNSTTYLLIAVNAHASTTTLP